MWVARDKDGSLFLYNNKPWRQNVDGMWIDNGGMYVDWKDETMYSMQLPTEGFPDLKWEDEPVEAEFNLNPYDAEIRDVVKETDNKSKLYNMIREDYVTFEQAKLLKEKGFPQNIWLGIGYDEFGNEVPSSFVNDDTKYVNCPTLALVQKWLRKEKEFDVFVTVSKTKSEFPYSWNIIVNRGYEILDEELPYIYSTEPVSTPEQALSEGIDKALTLI